MLHKQAQELQIHKLKMSDIKYCRNKDNKTVKEISRNN